MFHLPFILAAAAPAPAGGLGGTLMFLLPVMIIFYILMIKPQRKREKEHKEMLQTLRVNDRVLTAGGIHGVVAAVKESSVVLKVADGVKIEFALKSIAAKLSDDNDAKSGNGVREKKKSK